MFLSKHKLTKDEIKEIKESWDKPGAILKCPGRMSIIEFNELIKKLKVDALNDLELTQHVDKDYFNVIERKYDHDIPFILYDDDTEETLLLKELNKIDSNHKLRVKYNYTNFKTDCKFFYSDFRIKCCRINGELIFGAACDNCSDYEKEGTKDKMKKAILDCWDLLEPKPYYHCGHLSSRIPPLRDKEIIENQTNLLDDLRNIIESIANEIMKQED